MVLNLATILARPEEGGTQLVWVSHIYSVLDTKSLKISKDIKFHRVSSP